MRILAAAFLLPTLGATPALAQDRAATPFEGPSVTAIFGVDRGSDLDTNGTGVTYGGQVSYDWQSGSTVFGIEGEITGASTSFCTTNTFPGTYCNKAGRDLYVGGRLGRVVGRSTMIYVKAGYTNARDTFNYYDGGTGATNRSGSGTRDGVRGGIGVEKLLGASVVAKVEYRYSNYGDSSYSRHQGVVGLGFKF